MSTVRYINRELSWLKFNQRVLNEAYLKTVPLLERLRYLAIVVANYDEFYMTRIANLRNRLRLGITTCDSPEQADITSILQVIDVTFTQESLKIQKYLNAILDEMKTKHITLIRHFDQLSVVQQKQLKQHWQQYIAPKITPLTIGPSYSTVSLTNLSLYLLTDNLQQQKTLVEIHSSLPRFIVIKATKETKEHYIPIETVVLHYLPTLANSVSITDYCILRITKDMELPVSASIDNLKKDMQEKLTKREEHSLVRLEVIGKLDEKFHAAISQGSDLSLMTYSMDKNSIFACGFEQLCIEQKYMFPAFTPVIAFKEHEGNIFNLLDNQDLLLHHPYDSFVCVEKFIEAAALDPKVTNIKLTLYRCSSITKIISLLIAARKRGKQVIVVIELKARFDEAHNLYLTDLLYSNNITVLHGLLSYKVHCKMCLIVRDNDHGDAQSYVHLSTGNYNSETAKLYTDLGLLTTNSDICADVMSLFNILTGNNNFTLESKHAVTPSFKSLGVSPYNLRQLLNAQIDRLIHACKKGHKCELIAKLNHICDRNIIDKLYEASQAGVKIRLIIRGVCSLIPGIKGVSSNIKVISIVGRFLEHSRCFCFTKNNQSQVFISSADWLKRSMDSRIELIVPIHDSQMALRLKKQILECYWADNTKAQMLQSSKDYKKRLIAPSSKKHNAQLELISLHHENT